MTWDTATSRLSKEYSSRNEAPLSSPATNTKVKSEPRALKSLARVKCYNCNKYGKYVGHCREPRGGKKHQSRTDERRVHFDPNDCEKVQQALMARSGRATSTELIVDSGATSHMIGNRAPMRNNSAMPEVMISHGDGRRVRSNETGDVYISTGRGNQLPGQLILRNAMYVPEFDSNLLSCSELANQGYRVVFDRNQSKIFKGEELVAVAQSTKGLYVLKPVEFSSDAANLSKKADSWKQLWHSR